MPILVLIGLASYVQVSLGTAYMMAAIFLYPVVFLEASTLYGKIKILLVRPHRIPVVLPQDGELHQDLEPVTLQGEWIPGNLSRIAQQEHVDPMIGDVKPLPRPWIDHRANVS